MAREMYLVGVDEEELQAPPPPEGPKTFKEKLQHFWFYYKWPVLGGLAAVVVAVILIVQLVNRPHYDYTVVLVTDMAEDYEAASSGTGYVNSETLLSEELAKYGRDLDGDGTVTVSVEHLSIAHSGSTASTSNQKFMAHLAAGDVMFYIFDKTSYDELIKALEGESFFSPLDLDMENVDSTAGYYNWKDDPRRQTNGLENLPEELYFGTRGATGTASKKQEEAAQCRELLIAFITDTPLEAGIEEASAPSVS